MPRLSRVFRVQISSGQKSWAYTTSYHLNRRKIVTLGNETHARAFLFPALLYLAEITNFSKIQLVVYHQSCVLIGLATSRLYVMAH